MKPIQKAFIGVVTSVSVAAVAVLGRTYLQQVVTSLQYHRKLLVLAAEYKAALRDVERRADEVGAAYFESRRDYFVHLANGLDQSEVATEGALANMLLTTQKVAAMQLRISCMRLYSIRLREIGAKQEAAKLQEELHDQEHDNNDDYIPRMRQSGFPVNDLLDYLRHNMPETI